jgi:hypothetical protein
MKKFREFLKQNANLTKGDVIGILISAGYLLAFNMYVCKKLEEVENQRDDLLQIAEQDESSDFKNDENQETQEEIVL